MIEGIDKYPRIICPWCRAKGLNKLMRPRQVSSGQGEEVRYFCMETDCHLAINPKFVPEDCKLENEEKLVFEKILKRK